jgi:hypothetical protein
MNKPNIILDLDNTIISSLTPSEFKKYKHNCAGMRYTKMKKYFNIFHRPYLQEFLDFIFEHFNVCVWTAGTKDYCLFIVKNIILNHQPYENGEPSNTNIKRNLKLILHAENCDQSEFMYQTPSPKDLRYIYQFPEFSSKDTFIVDDLDQVRQVNPNNVLPAKYFDAKNSNCVKDKYLLNAIPTLQKILNNYK